MDFIANSVITVQKEMKKKSDCFMFLDSDSNIFNSFLLLSLIFIQLLNSIQAIESRVKESINVYLKDKMEQIEQQDNLTQKDRIMYEKKNENFKQDLLKLLQETYNFVKNKFTKKLERNLKQIN